MASENNGIVVRQAFAYATLIALTGVSLLSYFKGWNNQIQIWGQPYWLINYSDGLIKRGFLGALFTSIYNIEDLDRLWGAVLTFHTLISTLMIFALLAWLGTIIRSDNRSVLLATACVFATSQFLPTLAYNTGYLDAPIYLILAIAAAFLSLRVYWPAVMAGAIGPFVHESFIFLWVALSILLFVNFNRHDVVVNFWKYAVILSAVLSTTALYFFHSQTAASIQFSQAPLSDDVSKVMINITMGRSITSSIDYMVKSFSENSENVLFSIVFFCVSTVVMIVFYAVSASLRKRDFALLSAAAFAPAGILLLAWDLSRFLVATNLSAFIAIVFMQSQYGTPLRQNRVWLFLVLGVSAVYLALPLVYNYFDSGAVIDSGILPLTHTKLGRELQWYIENRYSH